MTMTDALVASNKSPNTIAGTLGCAEKPTVAYTDCPSYNLNIYGRHGEEIHENVYGWADCSKLCSQRKGCTNWIWHRGTAGIYAYQCVTMTGSEYGSEGEDTNTVSGMVGCQGKQTYRVSQKNCSSSH